MKTIETYTSDISHLDDIRKNVDEYLRTHQFTESASIKVLICLSEAVTNAVIHGNKNCSDKLVSVSYEADVSGFLLEVEDSGSGFDYDQIPDPTCPGVIDKPNGRGIYLMKRLAHSVRFENKGRKIILTFKRN